MNRPILVALGLLGAGPVAAQSSPFAPTATPIEISDVAVNAAGEPVVLARTGRTFLHDGRGWQAAGHAGWRGWLGVLGGVLLNSGGTRSLDGGRTWTPGIGGLYLSVSNGHAFFGDGAGSGVVTRDGLTARWLPNRTNPPVWHWDLFSVAAVADTLVASALLVADSTDYGLFRLRPGDEAWRRMPDPAHVGSRNLFARGDTLFADGAPGYRSDDGGRSWTALPVSAPITAFAEASGGLFAATDAGLLRYEAGVWKPTALVVPVRDVAGTGSVLLARTLAGFLRSDDGGRTFADLGPGPTATSAELHVPAGPAALVLAGPNPFARRTRLALDLTAPAAVRIALHDVLGREVARLHAGPLPAGRSAFEVDAAALRRGAYVVRAAVGPVVLTRTLTHVRVGDVATFGR